MKRYLNDYQRTLVNAQNELIVMFDEENFYERFGDYPLHMEMTPEILRNLDLETAERLKSILEDATTHLFWKWLPAYDLLKLEDQTNLRLEIQEGIHYTFDREGSEKFRDRYAHPAAVVASCLRVIEKINDPSSELYVPIYFEDDEKIFPRTGRGYFMQFYSYMKDLDVSNYKVGDIFRYQSSKKNGKKSWSKITHINLENNLLKLKNGLLFGDYDLAVESYDCLRHVNKLQCHGWWNRIYHTWDI